MVQEWYVNKEQAPAWDFIIKLLKLRDPITR